MFYARINKLKIFDNKEGFLGLFKRAEIRIYSYAAEHISSLTLADLAGLSDDNARKDKLAETVQSAMDELSQSYSLDIDGVKDNQTLLFGESGLVLYQSAHIPNRLNMQLWVIESDEDVRRFSVDMEQIAGDDTFKGLVAAAGAALAITNPILTGTIGVGRVVLSLLRKKLKTNKDDLVGYWQCALNRQEHYPHGIRDRQDIPDSTGNILVDYTLFGYENGLTA
jgi:hypothetical protein